MTTKGFILIAMAIEGTRMASEVHAWITRGSLNTDLAGLEFTNRRTRMFMFSTNLLIHGRTQQVILRLDSARFRKRGRLLATKAGDIYWEGTDGSFSIVVQNR